MNHEKGDNMLKMTLSEIRGQIQMYPENWINVSTTNCYAYALGLDIKEDDICLNAYQPGTISKFCERGVPNKYLTCSNLIKAIEKDLKGLNISYREIEPQELIALDEWKIALLVKEYYDHRMCKRLLSDFHFLRINRNGLWTHKVGYFAIPNEKDFTAQVIMNPRECDLGMYEYKKCYALKLNKR